MLLNGHEVPLATLPEVIAARSSLGDKVFAVIDGESITYADVNIRANRLAHGLAARGVSKGDVVVTYMHNSVEHMLAWFAAIKLGAIWAPINIALINLDLQYTIKNVGPKAIVLDGDLADNYVAIRDSLELDGLVEIVKGSDGPDFDAIAYADALADDVSNPAVEMSPSDPASIMFTGGSTGMPKGVIVSHLWYVVGALRYREMFDPKDDDVHLGVGQLCHAIGSAIDVFCPLYYGLSTSIPRWFSGAAFWETARETQATIVGCLVGPLIAMMCSSDPSPADREHTIRVASSGTAQIPSATVTEFERRFGIELLEIYAQTETGPLLVGQRALDKPYHSQGKPNGWCDVMIADLDDQQCGPNVTGQILMRPTVPHTFLLGYHNVPDKYVEATRNLWFHTGDIGYIDEQGFLFFTGRLAHAIRVRGENVSAFEVEQAVAMFDAITECAAVGVPSKFGEEEIKIFVEVAAGAAFAPADLIAFLQERIAYFKVPRYIAVIDEWPRSTAKNEIERHQLRERGIDGAWDREAAGIKVRRRS